MMNGNERPPRDGSRAAQPRVTRRDVVKGLGTGVTGVATLAAATGPVAASHADAKPNHVTISDDTAWLERYRPMLDLRNVPHSNRPELLGWKFTSTDPDVELDVGVYAAEYAVQKDWISLTSHAGDHEWIYVFVDSRTGEVDHVSYAAYHWLRGYVLDPAISSSDGGEHPMFRVATTYHNYIPLAAEPSSGVLLDVKSLGDHESQSGPLYNWLANGLESDLAQGAVHEPWTLAHDGPLDAWWSREGSGQLNRYIVDAWALISFGFGIGIRGADEADPGDADL